MISTEFTTNFIPYTFCDCNLQSTKSSDNRGGRFIESILRYFQAFIEYYTQRVVFNFHTESRSVGVITVSRELSPLKQINMDWRVEVETGDTQYHLQDNISI